MNRRARLYDHAEKDWGMLIDIRHCVTYFFFKGHAMSDTLKDNAMRFFKKPWFQRFAEKEDITDSALKSLVKGMEEGRINADLGGFVYKQRLAREGGGKSGGYRVLLFYRKGDRVFFAFGFAKSDQANISRRDLVILKTEAQLLMECAEADLAKMVREGMLVEF